jgi:hypothetical protein
MITPGLAASASTHGIDVLIHDVSGVNERYERSASTSAQPDHVGQTTRPAYTSPEPRDCRYPVHCEARALTVVSSRNNRRNHQVRLAAGTHARCADASEPRAELILRSAGARIAA